MSAAAPGEAELPEFCGGTVVAVDRLIGGTGVDLARTQVPWLDGGKGVIGYWAAPRLRGRGLAGDAQGWAVGGRITGTCRLTLPGA